MGILAAAAAELVRSVLGLALELPPGRAAVR